MRLGRVIWDLMGLTLLAQVSPEDVSIELARLQRNSQFLSNGFAAAWIVLVVYVMMMVGRECRLKNRQSEGDPEEPQKK